MRLAGAVAVSVLSADESDELLEPDPGRTPLWNAVRIEGLFPADADLSALSGLDLDVDFLADRDWSETWRRGLVPMRFGRLLVVPRHLAPDGTGTVARAGEVVVRLDPGLAFGTGTHATTALCLHYLARTPLNARRVLDVGAGSGILAIAAARLGAAVVAVDHDPQARRATTANARANGVELAVLDDLDAVDGRFDAVVANLVAHTIRDLAGALVERLDPGGELVLSGILAGQVEWVMDAFSEFPQCRFEPPVHRDGWAMLQARRCPKPSNR